MKYSEAKVLADDLHRFANFVELRYHMLPDGLKAQPYTWVWGWDGEDVPEVMASAARAGLGQADEVKKDYRGTTMNLTLHFGKLVYTIHCERDKVCVKRVVGTKMVKKQVPVGGYEEQEVEEDVVEWDCHPLLAAANDE